MSSSATSPITKSEDDGLYDYPAAPRTITAHLSPSNRRIRRAAWRRQLKYCIENDLPLPFPHLNPDYQHAPCEVTFRISPSVGQQFCTSTDWFYTILVDDPIATTVEDLNRMLKTYPPIKIKHCIPGNPDRPIYPDERIIKLDHTRSPMRSSSLDRIDDREIKLWQIQYGSNYVDYNTNIASICYLWEDPTKIHLVVDIGHRVV